jgi:hypothetical protein
MLLATCLICASLSTLPPAWAEPDSKKAETEIRLPVWILVTPPTFPQEPKSEVPEVKPNLPNLEPSVNLGTPDPSVANPNPNKL